MAVVKPKKHETRPEQEYKSLRKKKRKYRWLTILWIVILIASGAGIQWLSAGMNMFLLIASIVLIIYNVAQIMAWNRDSDTLWSGIYGEQSATQSLVGCLDDSHVIYQNLLIPSGAGESEADIVIVGPSGVFVTEVKNHVGHISGNPEATTWYQTKTGQGGTEYTTSMPNPLLQVRGPQERLQALLRARGLNTSVTGLVYFSNEQVMVDIPGMEHTNVYVCYVFNTEQKIHTLSELAQLIGEGQRVLGDDQIQKICDVLDAETR